jgi:hypothetical protein
MTVIERTKTLKASAALKTRKSDAFAHLDSVTGERLDRQQILDVETDSGNTAATAASSALTKDKSRAVKFQLPDVDNSSSDSSDSANDTPFSTARTLNKFALRSSRSMRRLGHTFGRSMHGFASRKLSSQRYSLLDVISAEVEANQLQQQLGSAGGKCVSSAPEVSLPPMFSVVEDTENEGDDAVNGGTTELGKDTTGTAAAAATAAAARSAGEEGEVMARVVRVDTATGQSAPGALKVECSSVITEARSEGPFKHAALEPFGSSDTCTSSKKQQQGKEEGVPATAAAAAAGLSSAAGSKRAATVPGSSAAVGPKRVSFLKRELPCSDKLLASRQWHYTCGSEDSGALKSNSVMRLATATVETSSDYC